MALPLFPISLPPTKKFKVWMATTGGHVDKIIIAITDPENKKRWEDDDEDTELRVPEDSLRLSLPEFLIWFCNDNPDILVEMGLLKRRLDGDCRPLSTQVEKWVEAEIVLPCEIISYSEFKDGKNHHHKDVDNVYGLNLYDQFG